MEDMYIGSSSLNVNEKMDPEVFSIQSGAPSLGVANQIEVLNELIPVKEHWLRRNLPSIKLICLTSIPLITLVILAAISLLQANQSIRMANQLNAQMTLQNDIKDVVTALQRERGVTCFYLSSSTGGKLKAGALVGQFRAESNIMAKKATNSLKSYPGLQCDSELFNILVKFRKKIGDTVLTCKPVLKWYTSLIDCLLNEIEKISRTSKEGLFWSKLQSLNMLLSIDDLIGVKRAMGGMFFGSGGFDDESLKEYIAVSTLADTLFKLVKRNAHEIGELHINLSDENVLLLNDLNTLEDEILTNNSIANSTKGLIWFDKMTEIMSIRSKLETSLSHDVVTELNERVSTETTNFWGTIAFVSITIIVCPVLTVIHGIKSHRLLVKVAKYTNDMRTRNHEIKAEKMRTEQLLCQMLPHSVAKILLRSGTVDPERFEEVTVYFSDIKDFTRICSRSTPFEVIGFLNDLYTKCDQILDLYDCYKVETIGDAYMVVSGLPNRNSHNHSNQICSLALEILMTLESLHVPHMPQQKLRMRIGIHTGPCAAGVVGSKMPRYCLFGDTVNQASRMESTSLDLAQYHSEFECLLRGPVRVKGKGVCQTYWLVGKTDFPFHIDVSRDPPHIPIEIDE